MATTAVEPVFIDTNILVYANVFSAPQHLSARSHLQDLAAYGVKPWISRQVLREYMATLTRVQTFTNPVSPAELTVDIHRFEEQYNVAEDGPQVTAHLLNLLGDSPESDHSRLIGTRILEVKPLPRPINPHRLAAC